MLKFLLNLDFYFTPKFFEKSGRIYELLGVRIFKKFLPTYGDYMLRLTGIRLINNGSTETLKDYETATKIFEMIHLVFCLLYICFSVSILLNLMINIYPIMVQRYNRARIYKILRKREQLL